MENKGKLILNNDNDDDNNNNNNNNNRSTFYWCKFKIILPIAREKRICTMESTYKRKCKHFNCFSLKEGNEESRIEAASSSCSETGVDDDRKITAVWSHDIHFDKLEFNKNVKHKT